MSDNTITVVGNITKEPELKFLGSGNAAVKFSIAVNKRRKGKDGEYEESTSFFDVQAYGTLAENLANSVTKGNRIVVTGEIEQRSWDDKNTGDKRSKVEVVADEIAPSLRWATAQVTRNERRSDGGSPRPAPAAAPAPTDNQAASAGYGYDEEPF